MAQWNHPVSIPNLEVKRCSADGSTAIGRVRVGRCQFFPPPAKRGVVFFARISRALKSLAALVMDWGLDPAALPILVDAALVLLQASVCLSIAENL